MCRIALCNSEIKCKGLCQKHYDQQYAAKNREKRRQQRKAWKSKNIEIVRECNRKYLSRVKNNLVPVSKKCSIQSCVERHKAKGLCHRHYILESHVADLSWKYKKAHKDAIKRGLSFSLSEDEYMQIVNDKHCHYCGGPLPKSGHGLDRVDSRQGYYVSNLVPCCSLCNSLKSKLSVDSFLNQVACIVRHQSRKCE